MSTVTIGGHGISFKESHKTGGQDGVNMLI